jgi:hypothetical protein
MPTRRRRATAGSPPPEPWMLASYLALKASGKPQYYLLLSEDEVMALAEGVVLSRTVVQATQALETLEELCARHQRAREAEESHNE